MKAREAVNHPSHYGGVDSLYEAIKVIRAWNLGFSLGNAVKYICRAEAKGATVEDLKKSALVSRRIVTVTEKFGRYQHHVNYAIFRWNRLVPKVSAALIEGVNNYGMELVIEDAR